ncbi:hypothetical protein [Streptomyces sp. NBC_00154]|uniref:hypothetical protein n=1 Tax=Streptomyces sp. NBC_00154 TaxID=2975670 RepID=UPI00225BA274|nr:hypothetical protein [Streptomyces sp. NBC_00154]MCX5312496.1 hypothetical protein [Streptomyces sp. NBC_00154]
MPFGHAAHAVTIVRVGMRWKLLARKDISAPLPETTPLHSSEPPNGRPVSTPHKIANRVPALF